MAMSASDGLPASYDFLHEGSASSDSGDEFLMGKIDEQEVFALLPSEADLEEASEADLQVSEADLQASQEPTSGAFRRMPAKLAAKAERASGLGGYGQVFSFTMVSSLA